MTSHHLDTAPASAARWTRRLFGLGLASLLSGCQCGDDPLSGRLAENIGASFADCNAARIRFLAAKHNVQLVFSPCGQNAFKSYAWSPDGLRIAYQLVFSTYVMNADAPGKNNLTLPIPQSLGPMAWLSPTRLVVAIGPRTPRDPPVRLAIVDLPLPDDDNPAPSPSQLVTVTAQGVHQVDHLGRAESGEVLLMGKLEGEAESQLYLIDLGSGAPRLAYPWLAPGMDNATAVPGGSKVVVSRGGEVLVHERATGELLRTFPDATRGLLDPTERYLALEHPGPLVSAFGQRAWGEVPEAVRDRERRRTEAFEQRLPEHLRQQVRPPMISLVDLQGGERLTLTSAMGDHFSWYEPAPGWGSFFLWGFEGRQVKRNVTLVRLQPHLSAASEGVARFGTVLYDDLSASSLEQYADP